MIRAIRWHDDATDAYRRIYLERFGRPSYDWIRRDRDEQEARRADTQP